MNSKNMEEIVHHSYTSKPKYNELKPGVPEDYKQINTLEDLLKINYKHVSVEQQMRGNLIIRLKKEEHPYSGIIGYEEDVIPSVNRSILSGHDMLFVGQIGQAKTKIAESISKNLLSPIPTVRGTITNDIPTSIPEGQLIALLTESDISVKDLVGQIDAIKIAKKGVELYDIASYSPGQLLQARHGILCIDELPVLDPRKQVALLSVLQEGKFTTGSYPVIFKPDVRIIATANPIDYTHSGKII